MASLDLSALQTEARSPHTTNIDNVSTIQLCRIINAQDTLVAPAVATCLQSIAAAIDEITARIKKGGRLISLGAGTSGRLGVLDASELPPTFHASPSQFVALIAGGDSALRSSIEGAEDSPDLGVQDLLRQCPTSNDVILGIAASGRTPYVLGALRQGHEEGCLVVGIVCTRPSEMGSARDGNGNSLCDIIIECITGAEVVTGSTRLRAGTATKMILNMISTGVMVKLGKTYGNLMVDLKASNTKLQIRAHNIFRSLCPAGIYTSSGKSIQTPLSGSKDDETLAWNMAVDELIQNSEGSVKLAILIAKLGCGLTEGKQRLSDAGGVLAVALENARGPDVGHNSLHGTQYASIVPRLVLCIDGGGTKTAAVIAQQGGGILARGEAGISNITAVGLDATLDAIKAATMNALSAISPSISRTYTLKIPSPVPIFNKVWAGVAGVDRPSEFGVLLAALERLFSLSHTDGSILLTNDGFLLTSPIQNNPDTDEGVVVISGTGSIAISYRTAAEGVVTEGGKGKDRLVQMRRSGGWGHVLGDEGSAFMTGRSAIRSVLTAIDIGQDLLPWHREILDHFGATSGYQLISCVVSVPSAGKLPHEADNARKVRIAECSNIVLRAFESGDQTAEELMKGTAKDIVGLIKPLTRSLSHPEGITPTKSTLCLGGGLMKQSSFWQLLVTEMKELDWEWNKVEIVNDAAAAGAKFLAQDH